MFHHRIIWVKYFYERMWVQEECLLKYTYNSIMYEAIIPTEISDMYSVLLGK